MCSDWQFFSEHNYKLMVTAYSIRIKLQRMALPVTSQVQTGSCRLGSLPAAGEEPAQLKLPPIISLTYTVSTPQIK